MEQKTVFQEVITFFLMIFFYFILYWTTNAQGVGIGTLNPQAVLHVAGNLKVDTAVTVFTTKRITVFDSLGYMQSFPFDSFKSQVATVTSSTNPTYYVAEVPGQASTTSASPQTRVTLTLPAGTYILFIYGEMFNTGTDAGVRAWVREGATELAFGIVYSNTATYGSWGTFCIVRPTTSTDYTFLYSSYPSGTTSFIRRARMFALKLL